jgi:hypothetical protein
MRWRLLKLDWNYALGELVIVTVGVLIALAIDQWNDGRLERDEEASAVAGLLADLEEDLESLQFTIDLAAEKKVSLLRVQAALAADALPEDPRAFLQDVINGANFGWSQGLASRSTYDDLLGSGKLGLIRDRDIRQAIATYYLSYESEGERIDERETPYPDMSYALIPRRTDIVRERNVGDIWLADDLSDDDIVALVAAVRQSPIGGYVTAEINLADFIRAIKINQQQRAIALAEQLREYSAAWQ